MESNQSTEQKLLNDSIVFLISDKLDFKQKCVRMDKRDAVN